MRGNLTEGRYVTIESNGFALTNPFASNSSGAIGTSSVSEGHEDIKQRWVVHQLDVENDGNEFYISSVLDERYLRNVRGEVGLVVGVTTAQAFVVSFSGNGAGYSFQAGDGTWLSIDSSGGCGTGQAKTCFQLFFVTYSS
jgi:phospholipase C